MREIRFDTISGKIEDVGSTGACVQFNEWYDKAGLDLYFYDNLEVKQISLTKDELHALALIMCATKFVDVPSLQTEAEEYVSGSLQRAKQKLEREAEAVIPSEITGLTDYEKVLQL